MSGAVAVTEKPGFAKRMLMLMFGLMGLIFGVMTMAFGGAILYVCYIIATTHVK